MYHETNDILQALTTPVTDRKEETKARVSSIKAQLQIQPTTVAFPLDAFPPKMAEMIRAYSGCYGSAPEHYGLAMLVVAGTAIGNSCWVQERNSKNPPLIYGAIVDLPGRGKTPIVNTLLAPIRKLERIFREEHAEKLRAYRQAQTDGDEQINPPMGREVILNNFTVESVFKVLKSNPRGCMVFRDEIAGWLNSMNAYKSKGSDEEFWLEGFNGGMIKVNRVNDLRPLFVPNAFCAVMGTTQPGMLTSFAEGKKGYNGFLARILFSFPDNTQSAPYSTQIPSPLFREHWEQCINYLVALPIQAVVPEDEYSDWHIHPTPIPLSEGANRLYRKFFDSITEQTNQADEEVTQAMLTKFKTHSLRIALILHFLHWAEEFSADNAPIDPADVTASWLDLIGLDEVAGMQISAEVMGKAIAVSNYFVHTSLKVVGKLGHVLDQIPNNIRVWYDNLPDTFQRKDILELAHAANISERSLQRLLNNGTWPLFKRLRHGVYEKNFV